MPTLVITIIMRTNYQRIKFWVRKECLCLGKVIIIFLVIIVQEYEATRSYSKNRSNSIKSNFMIEVTEPRRLKNNFLKASNFKFDLLVGDLQNNYLTKDKNRNNWEVEHEAEPEDDVSDDDGWHQGDFSKLLVDENGDILSTIMDTILKVPDKVPGGPHCHRWDSRWRYWGGGRCSSSQRGLSCSTWWGWPAGGCWQWDWAVTRQSPTSRPHWLSLTDRDTVWPGPVWQRNEMTFCPQKSEEF